MKELDNTQRKFIKKIIEDLTHSVNIHDCRSKEEFEKREDQLNHSIGYLESTIYMAISALKNPCKQKFKVKHLTTDKNNITYGTETTVLAFSEQEAINTINKLPNAYHAHI